jgi:hypothetical protein
MMCKRSRETLHKLLGEKYGDKYSLRRSGVVWVYAEIPGTRRCVGKNLWKYTEGWFPLGRSPEVLALLKGGAS